MVQEVQVLNKKIESINVQRTKAEAKVDMLKKQLMNELASYKNTYGVDLSDKNFSKLSGKVKSELAVVTDQIKGEYDLKCKVVDAIDKGDYETAYKLLGVETEEEVEEEPIKGISTDVDPGKVISIEEAIKPVVASFDDDAINNQQVTTGVMLDSEDDFDIGSESGAESGADDSDEYINFGFDDEEEPKKPAKKEDKGEAISGGIVLDDDLVVEDEDTPERPFKGQSAVEAVSSVGDDDGIPSMDDDDWGFGNILQGSQFQAD